MLFSEEVPYFHSRSKPKAHAVRVARTVVLEAGQENLVRGQTQFVEPVEKGVMLSPTKGVVENTPSAGRLLSRLECRRGSCKCQDLIPMS